MRVTPFVSFLAVAIILCIIMAVAGLIILQLVYFDVQTVSWAVGFSSGVLAMIFAVIVWLSREFL